MGNLHDFDKDDRKIGQDRGAFSGDAAQMAGDTEKMLRKAAKQAAREILNEKKKTNVATAGAAAGAEAAEDQTSGPEGAADRAERQPEGPECTEAGTGAADKKPAAETDAADWDWAEALMKKPGSAAEDPVEVQNRRIRKEKNRLKKQFKGIDDRNRAMVEGLIEQAAFMRVQLQDLSDDIIENGVTELFSQGKDQEPYERRRPVADLYNSMNANYQKIIKQLNDLLPKPLKLERGAGDGFVDFVADRDEF